MSYIGVIVESPAKCRKIEKYLGSNYRAIASFGHFRELNGLNSIDIENSFQPTFNNMVSKSQQINKLRDFIANASEVILAADDDREGEAIAWHICDTFNLSVKDTKRIIFHEITETALKRAVQNPQYIDMNLVYAQQSRQVLDLLVGFKVSPILWNKISYKTKTPLSAGRCQTPALRLVYDNQKEIETLPSKKVYNTTGYFTSMNLPFVLNFNHDTEESMSTFLEKTAQHEHIYTCSKERNTIKSPPTPFTTSSLQQTASNELNLSPKMVMDSCQKLYEAGYITYMRTDSITYSAVFLAEAKKYIENKYGEEYVSPTLETLSERNVTANKRVKKKKKDTDNKTQEAHEAIRPTLLTRVVKVEAAIGPREVRVYKLIFRNTVESCMSAAKYMSITAEITAPEKHAYKYLTELVVFPGWKKVKGCEKTNEVYTFLKLLKSDSILNYHKVVSKMTMKDLKPHFTEAKLVQLLESQGIGRPSTFSSLIDKIQERGYVKKTDVPGKNMSCTDFELSDDELSYYTTSREFGGERNKLVIQPLGIMVIEFLITHFNDLFQYEYTKTMEHMLDQVAKGKHTWHKLCRQCYDTINKLSQPLDIVDKIHIPIDKHNTYIIGKYGPVIKNTNGKKITFKPVADNIDITRLKNNEYTLDEIIANKDKNINNRGDNLGKFQGHPVILKNGRYGQYIECDKRTYNIPSNHVGEITLQVAIQLMSNIRYINNTTSIREGRYGAYIYIKSNKQGGKPTFLHLKGFTHNPYLCDIKTLCEWVTKTHNRLIANK